MRSIPVREYITPFSSPMKLRLPSLLRRLLIAATTVTGVTIGTSNTQAGVMHEDISIMTYTDFGQNKGRYTTTANALLDYIRQRDGGIVITYTGGQNPYIISNEQGMISYESQTDNGAAAAVGYSYLGTVEHNGEIDASFGSRYLGEENSVKYSAIEYRGIGEYRNVPNTDYKVTRQSKIITDVTPSTLFTGDINSLGGTMMYRAGAGNMYIRDAEGNQSHVMDAYNYIIGGINAIDSIWSNGTFGEDAADWSYSLYWQVDNSAAGVVDGPLANALGAGDSGSPVWVYNAATGQYEYLAASQSGTVTTDSYARGAGEYSQKVIDEDTVAVNAASTTLYINQVSDTAVSSVTGGGITSEVWQGTITDGTDTVATFNGVKTGVNTWKDLSALKDEQNWYGYGEVYLNAAWNRGDAGKELNFGDLFHTNNVMFGTTMVDGVLTATTDTSYNIILTDKVDLGVGYVQFVGSGNTFTITSEGDENNQFNHAGYVVEKGVTVHLQLTNPADYMYEWRKTGEGDLYIDGTGNTNALLNLGGSGKTFLQQTDGHAAYNVLANNGTYVSIKNAAQIDRDFTFGLGGATLDLNGVSMDWYYTAETADNLDDSRFSINALTEEAIITNSSSTASSLTFKESGNQTFLGSFRDTADGALSIVYDVDGGTWTLHSIWTDLSHNAGSGLSVAQGKVILAGTHTAHAMGSAGATTTNRYTNDTDWHYADAKMNVSVAGGATFELGSHARLTGDVTVADGGTFIMREGVQHNLEYIEGGQTLESTGAIAAYFGLKGNVTLGSNAHLNILYNHGVTATVNAYSGNITGAGNVSVNLGNASVYLTLSGNNTFTGTKTLDNGGIIATSNAALGGVETNKWVLRDNAWLASRGFKEGVNILSYIDATSTGTLALSNDLTTQLDLSGHTGIFIGAEVGKTVQYGATDGSAGPLAAVNNEWKLGGGGGTLEVNYLLTGSNNLILGKNANSTGTVVLNNAANDFSGSITFGGAGVVLEYVDGALGQSTLNLTYGNSVALHSNADIADRLAEASNGVVHVDLMTDADIDLTSRDAVHLGAGKDTTYTGNISVDENGTYYFGGSAALTLFNGLAVNGTNNLVVDGQTHSGGQLILGAVSDITGNVRVRGYYNENEATAYSTGDMTLGFTADNALASAASVTVDAGGVLDVGSTTQTLNNVQVNEGGLLKGNVDGTLVFNMTEERFQRGSMQLGKAQKTGSANLVLSSTDNTWELFTIKGGTMFTDIDNVLSATGITRVEQGGTLNMNTWWGEATRIMHGNIVLGQDGILDVGDNGYKAILTGTLSVDAGATGVVQDGTWELRALSSNTGAGYGGIISFNASRLELNHAQAQTVGGTIDFVTDATLYSGGSVDNMVKQFNHINVASGKTLTIDESGWNTIWQVDKLTGEGNIVWNSDTTHSKTAQFHLNGANDFSGMITVNRNAGHLGGNGAYQTFLVLNADEAAKNASLALNGSAADMPAVLAINTADAQLKGLSGNAYSHLYAGAAVEGSSGTAPSSTRLSSLLLNGDGEYTYTGTIGSASDSTKAALSITMDGRGKQILNGSDIVLNELQALKGTLEIGSGNLTVLGNVGVAQGATMKLGDVFAVKNGQALQVLASDISDASATFQSALTVQSGGIISFDGAALSSTTAALDLSGGFSFESGAPVFDFSNYGKLTEGTAYILASGDWSSLASAATATGLEYLDATFSGSASQLTVTLSLKQDFLRWAGASGSYEWGSYRFGTAMVSMTGKSVVFDDFADHKEVKVTFSGNPGKVSFNASQNYRIYKAEDAEVFQTVGELVQEGTGTTTLEAGTIKVTGATTIKNGMLVVKDTTTLGGNVVGAGALKLDVGEGTNISLTLGGLGTLEMTSGTYVAKAGANAVDTIILNSGTTYSQDAITYDGHIEAKGGKIYTSGGTLSGSVAMSEATELNVAADTTTAFSAAVTQNGHLLTKQGAGTLQLGSAASGVVFDNLTVAEGVLKYDSASFSAGTLTVASGAKLHLDWGANLTASSINLDGTLTMDNGSGNYINTAIHTGDGAVIEGSYHGNSSTLLGTIDGVGTLKIQNSNENKFAVNSAIADGVSALNVLFNGNEVGATLGGKNTYTGGTTIQAGALTAASESALGTGAVTMNGGSLTLTSNLGVSTLTGEEGASINLNGMTLTVGEYNVTTDAVFAGALTGGSIAKVGTGTQTLSAAGALQNISVSEGALRVTATGVSGSIEVLGGELSLASSYTLGEGQSLLVGGNTSLDSLTLGGGVIMLDVASLQADSALLSTGEVTGDVLTILLAGGMPNVAGSYMLASGNWAGVNKDNISVAAQQTYAARSGAGADLSSTLDATEDGLYLVLSEPIIWAPTVDGTDDVWSSTAFSRYGTGAVGANDIAIFNADAIDKSVRVTEAVSVGGMQISGAGYSFDGDGSISLSGELSVSGGGDTSVIVQINIPTGPITVDGSELTIIELTPTNPSAPIVLTNAATLTIGDENHRYGAFSGKVTGDAGSQLHLYTTLVSDNYWQEDGRVHLLTDSTVQDVYIHGDLALNKFTNDGKQTNLQGANLHMDAGSNLVVRSSEATLTPTKGNIVLHGNLNLVTYSQVNAEGTNLTTDFTLAEGATGKLIKTDSGSITLSGDINVTGVSVTGGKLVVDNAAGTLSATGGLNLAANTAADITANTINFGTGNNSISMLAGATATINGQSVTTGHVEIVNGATLTLQGGSYTFNGKIGAAGNADSLIIFQGSAFATDGVGRNLNGTFRLESDADLTGGSVQVTSNATLQVNAGKTLRMTGGNLNLQSGSNLTLQNGSQIIVDSGRTLTMLGDIGTEGIASTITLAGGTLELNLAGIQTVGAASITQTVASKIVVDHAQATADAPLTSYIKNTAAGESMIRDLAAVEIKANNTLELQQNTWNTIWKIGDLSGAGNLTWNPGTTHNYTSRLIISGDGSDYTGTISLTRPAGTDYSVRPLQAFLELASDAAAQGAYISLATTNTNNPHNARTALAINTANATIQGLTGDAHAHLYAGVARANSGVTTLPASSAANTLTIAGNGGTFAGTVGKSGETAHLNLAMIGSGTQTFSGVAHVGDVSVSSGTLALSHADSKVHGNISVSGGALDFDGTYRLGAGQSLSIATAESEAASLAELVLAGGEIIFDATALSADTAALSVGTLSLSEGTASQTISLSHAASLTTNGRYLLATGDWTAAAADNFFTISGLRYGSTAAVRYENNVLYLDYTQSDNTIYVWDSATASGNWGDAHWDTAPNDAEGQTNFTAGGVAVFRSDAGVTVNSDVSATDLIVENNAHLTLTETAALTATSIFVDAGSTLTFATAKDGRTEQINGAGIVEVALTNSHGNALKLGADFAGETHVTSGYFTITDAQVGSKLVLANGVEMQSTAASGTTVTADVELLGAVKVHANEGKNITYTGSVIGTDAAVDYQAAGSAVHTFDGVADLHKLTTTDKATVNFNGQTTLGELANTSSKSTTVNFNGETSITTATISGASYTANIGATGEATITTANVSGGALNVNGTADITTANLSGGTLNVNGTATITTANLSGGTLNVNGTADITTQAISTGTAAVGGTGQLDITTTNISGGTLNLSTAQAELGAVTMTGGTLNLASAGLSVTGDLVMNNAAALHFKQAAGAATTYTLADVKMNADPGASAGSITIDSGVTVNAASLDNDWGLGSLTVNGAFNVSGELMYATGSGINAISGSGTITTASLTFSNYGTYNLSVEEMTVRGELNMLAEWVDSSINLNAGTLTVQGATNMKNGGNTRTLNISGGTLEMQGGGALAHGTLSLAAGVLAQQGGETTISNTFNISGGELKVEGGKLTLSALNNVTGGAVTLSGGALDVTKELAAKLMNGAASFTMSGGVLDLADQSFTAGTAADAISLTNTAGLALNSGTLALGNLPAAGTYYLFTSGAEDVWDSFTAANVTLNGENALRYGATLGYIEADGVTYATLTTTSDTAGNLTLYWDGGESGTWDGTQTNWNVAETLDGVNTDFNSGDSVVFNSNAIVTLSGATTAGTVSLLLPSDAEEGAAIRVSLNESAGALTAASINVAEGTTLEFATQKAGYTAANISGAGTVELTLRDTSNDWGNKLQVGSEFTGKTVVKDGRFTINDSSFGQILHLNDGVTGFQLTANYIFANDLEIGGTIEVHQNSGTNLTMNGTVTGDGTWTRKGGGTLDFNSTVSLGGFSTGAGATTNFNASTTLATATVTQGTTNFTGTTNITTATISGGTTNFKGETDISAMSISGGTVNFGENTDGDTTIGTQGGTITMTGGRLQLNLEGHNTTQTVSSKLVVNNTAATAENGSISYLKNNGDNGDNMQRVLTAVEIAAHNTLQLEQASWNTIWNINDLSGEGNLTWLASTNHGKSTILKVSGDGSDFTGMLKVERSYSNETQNEERPYQAFLELNSDAAVQGSVVNLDVTSTTTNKGYIAMAVNTSNAKLQGLVGDEYTHLYAGAAPSASNAGQQASTANNTLTIAGRDTYTFAGTVGTAAETAHLNLAMTGSGTQTFSGVAHVGDVSVSNGTLALSNASSVVHGDISVSGGRFSLGSSYSLGAGKVLSVFTGTGNAVTLGGIALAGGEMVFDASLLKLTSAETPTAALTLGASGTATVGEGGATVTLDFSKLSGALASGNYLLAAGDWSGAAAENVFTYNGIGKATLSATSTGLILNYSKDSVYTWVGGAADSAWTSANWDLMADEDAANNSPWYAGKDAVFNTSATVSVGDAVTAGTVSIQNNAQVTLNGSDTLSVEKLVVANGKLTLGELTNWTGISDITVKESGTLSLGWGTGLTASRLLLQGGTVELNNGGGSYNQLNAAIVVDGSGTINGSSTGDATDIQGSITGSGVLNIGKTHEDRNPIKISSTISDGAEGALGLHVVDTNVKLTGTNTYTGGTTIAEGATLTITKAKALSTFNNMDNETVLGKVSGAGTLVINLDSETNEAVAKGSGENANMGGFTGIVDVQRGQFYVGERNNGNDAGAETVFNASRVIVRADGALWTHFGGSNRTLTSAVDLMSGAELRNRDGNNKLSGNIRFNIVDPAAATPTYDSDGVVFMTQYWNKTIELSGLLEGDGTVQMVSPETGGKGVVKITGENNTFAGTYKVVDGVDNFELRLGSQTAAQYADINLATTTVSSYLMLDSDATINGLYGANAVQAQAAARTLTVSEGDYSGSMQNSTGTLSLTKQGAADTTLILRGANSYTGATTINGGTLELTGAVSMAAQSNIALASGTTLLLNATNTTAMALGNAISGTGTIHKKGAYETVLSGNVAATTINVKDGANQATNAGTLTLTGGSVTADTLYAAYGQVNIGAAENGNTFMTVGKVELGDSATGDATIGLAVRQGSTLSVTGSSNGTGGNEGHKNASFLVAEWNAAGTLDVQGNLFVQNAHVSLGDDASTINISGGTLAAKGIREVRDSNRGIGQFTLNLSDSGKLILGESGLDVNNSYRSAELNMGAGTVGMSADTTTIAEDVTLNSAEGTTFDTTKYAFETNAENVATDIERGTEGGMMTISGNISSADGVAAKMKVEGNGELTLNGNATLGGGLEVEQGAKMYVSSTASIESTADNAAATMEGAVSIKQATDSEAASITGTGDTAAVVNNSLITIAQGASLTVENMVIASSSQIIGQQVAQATYAMRSTPGVSELKLADTTIELDNANAQLTGENNPITMNESISLKQTGVDKSLTLNNAKVLSVTSDALSNVTIAANSSLHIDMDYEALFAQILDGAGLKDIDLLALTFENVNFADLSTTTITGSTGGYTLTAYYTEAVDQAVANATTVFFDVQAVPEPTSTTLSILALAALAARRRRR